MGSRRIKKNANHNVDGDEEASSAKKRLQKNHFRSHPLVDACDPGRPRVQPSGRSPELVPSRLLQQQTWSLHPWEPKHVMPLATIGHA
jgi:hypothetical protein